MAGRRGELRRETYFPETGDRLENHLERVVWEATRVHRYYTHTGMKVRYAVLVGSSAEWGQEVAILTIHDRDGSDWLSEINTIVRKDVRYNYSTVSGGWLKAPEKTAK